jgi:hypothetical protein
MKEIATMTPRLDAPCAPRGRYTGNTRYTSCPQLKETKIMTALTLGEWRDRTLEQVHFAAKEALDAVVVKRNTSIRECVAAAATGDINQCMAQGPNIDSVRRIAQGMAVSLTAAPGCALGVAVGQH